MLGYCSTALGCTIDSQIVRQQHIVGPMSVDRRTAHAQLVTITVTAQKGYDYHCHALHNTIIMHLVY